MMTSDSLRRRTTTDYVIAKGTDVSDSILPSKMNGLMRSGWLLSSSRTVTLLRSKHTLPDLPYDYAALEPTISASIMELHHAKHHQTYVNNLNVAEEKLAEAQAKNDVSATIALGPALRFNGGGHINHSIFWQNLTPGGSDAPQGSLKTLIDRDFGSFDQMKTKLSAAAVGVQGSGWAWLALDNSSKSLRVATCGNQDPLQPTTGLVPLFGIDVWEHAYYLQYKNVRPDYVKAIFNVANWNDVASRLEKALNN